MKTKLKNQKGFTIIEVLIVLAIAGLILLILFLAVPALQRNSRNTQTKTNAANLLAAVNEWSNNNNGKVPTGHSSTALTAPVTTNLTTATSVFYGTSATDTTTAARVGASTVQFSTVAYSTLPADGTLVMVVGFKCNAAGTQANDVSARSDSVVMAIETSGTSIAKCIDS